MGARLTGRAQVVSHERCLLLIHHAMKNPNLQPIHPGARIGHVHLKVADLERALAFYCGVLGFQLTQRYGPGAAFISAGAASIRTRWSLSGSFIVSARPFPESFSSSISPPCSRTIRLTMSSPRPLPAAFVVK